MRKTWCVAIGAIAVAGAVLAPATAWAAPASPTVDTPMTFTVTSGELTITAPDTASLGSGAPGTTVSAQLGQVVVTDDRALASAAWTATVSSTDFTTGAATPAEIIPAGDASYAVGEISTTGTITATGTDITMSNDPQAVVAGTDGVGDNTATWDPTVAVALPDAAVGGVYTATITHSVA